LNKATLDLDESTPGIQNSITINGKGIFTADVKGIVSFIPQENFTGDVITTYCIADTSGKIAAAPATITVSINAKPAPSLIINSPQSVCSPSFINLTASPKTWSATPSGGSVNYFSDALCNNSLNHPNNINISGTYFIQYTHPSNGCVVIKPISITVTNATDAPAAKNNTHCGAAAITLNANGAAEGEDYKWYSGENPSPVKIGGSEYTTNVLTATTQFYVSKYNVLYGCETARTAVEAIINEPASIAEAGPDQILPSVQFVKNAGQ